MKPEIQNKITKIFPWFDSYAECGDGWQWIILNLCREIDDAYFNFGREVEIDVTYVKEKWGILSFYYNYPFGGCDIIQEIVSKYEQLSKTTCEICGAEGKVIKDEYWISVRCEECRI